MQIAILSSTNHVRVDETAAALARAGMEVIDFTINNPVETLLEFSGFVVVSNFQNNQHTELVTALKHQSLRGKPIIGIEEGAIFLTRTGLIPGIWDNRAAIALSQYRGEESQCLGSNIRLTTDYQYNAFTQYLTPQDILNIPPNSLNIHFHIPPGLQLEMEMQGLNVFMYCDEHGNIAKKTDIAAISNKAGNVIAMLPNPFVSLMSDKLFHSMHDYIASKYTEQVEPLNYWPR